VALIHTSAQDARAPRRGRLGALTRRVRVAHTRGAVQRNPGRTARVGIAALIPVVGAGAIGGGSAHALVCSTALQSG